MSDQIMERQSQSNSVNPRFTSLIGRVRTWRMVFLLKKRHHFDG